MKGIRYNILKVQDLDSYRTLRLECLKNHQTYFSTTYEEECLKDELKFDPIIKKSSDYDFLMGAYTKTDHQLIGICGFISEKRTKLRHQGTLSQLYVQPTFCGQGIGHSLLKASLNRVFSLDVIEQVTLGVIAENLKAIQLYKRFGFREYGRLEHYLKNSISSYAHILFLLTKKEWDVFSKP